MTKKFLLIFTLLCAFAQGAWAQNYDVWDGVSKQQPLHYHMYNEQSDVVVIRWATELAWLADGGFFESPAFDHPDSRKCYEMNIYLAGDIDMSVANWVPLGKGNDNTKYQGKFYGSGHTIRYKIDGSSIHSNYQGLFYIIDENASVENLHVDCNIKVGNARFVAGVAAENNGTIENCWVSGHVESDHYHSSLDADLGGIAGINEDNGKIKYCCVTADVKNTDKNSGVGGIAGSNEGTIQHVTFYGTVSVEHLQDNKYVGDQDGTLENTYDAFSQSEYDDASGKNLYRYAIKYPYAIKITNVGTGTYQASIGSDTNVPGCYPDGIVTLTKTSGTAARVDIKDADGNWVYSYGDINSSLQITMPKKTVNVTAYYYEDWPTQGSGTEGDPYLITSTDDWNKFALNVTLGRSYSGKYVKLTNNVSGTRSAGSCNAADDNNYKPFSGTFDGDGHTLTINLRNQSRFGAPFKCVEGATIKNLHTAGIISGTGNENGKLLSGLVGISFGNTTITGCVSSVTLTTDFGAQGYEDAALAGFVAGTVGGSLTVSGCVFNGSMTGVNNKRCAGISGYEYSDVGQGPTTTIIRNCIFAPATLTVSTTDDGYTKTITRDGDATITNCYYTQTLGAAQGTEAIASTPWNIGRLLQDYVMMKAYEHGIFYNGVSYVDTNLASPITFTDGINCTLDDIGKVVCTDGSIYPTVSDATAVSKTAIAVITYINTNNNTGLAIALTDEGEMDWSTAKSTCEGKTAFTGAQWCLPSLNQWRAMFNANGGDYGNWMGLSTTITNAGGSGLMPINTHYYWSSTVFGQEIAYCVWIFNDGHVDESYENKSLSRDVRACLTFNIAIPTISYGSGTEGDPFIISSAADWNSFVNSVNDGNNYNDLFVKLTTDISVETMAGTDDANSFQGIFDGNGHKLTFNKGTAQNPFNEAANYCAPFRHVKNATIKNLHVDGTIYISVMKAAGLVGESHGALIITNCRSSININSSKSGDGTHGGFVATLSGENNAILIEGCVFDGSFATTNGTVGCGGFVGWGVYNKPTISNSLMKPSSVDANMLGGTFARWYTGNGGIYEPTIDTCYYVATTNLPTDQGTEAIASADVSPISIGIMVHDYGIVKVYAHALFFDGKYYYAPGTSIGTGTENDPYIISNNEQWETFATLVNNGTNKFNGKFVKLTADISVSEMVGTSEDNSFQGTFLGDGTHTLTFTKGTSESAFNEQNCAPFRYVNGANIRDLKVAGNIYTSQKFAAGLVSRPYGTTSITNCQVSTVIHSSVNGDGTHGGIVAMPDGTLNIEGCAYTGRLLTNNGTIKCGGFVGWHNDETISVINSLYAPSGSITEGWSAINDGATFVRGGNSTINNCYYTEALGTEQCKIVYTTTTTAPTNLGSLKEEYSMLTAYANGILFEGTYYVGRALNGAGTEGSPYIIATDDDWETFVYNVKNGFNNYNGQFVRLDENISVSTMVGTSDDRSFQGTFLGNNNTLTFTQGSSESAFGEEYCAPFRYVKNATIQDLKVAGDIYTSRKFAAGLIAQPSGTTNITDCLIGTVIHSSVNGDGTHGGIVARLSSNTTEMNITGCVFNGRLLTNNGTHSCAGFVGWWDSKTANIINSLYAPDANITPSAGETAITNGATFIRDENNATYATCYYTETLGVAQGTQAYAFATAPANLGAAGTNYGMVKAYANGILFNGTYYATSTGNISLSVEGYGTGTDKWAFIASPVNGNIAPTTVENIFSATEYDLYRLNPSSSTWENYKQHTGDFNIVNGQGYLYATKETKTLVFSGTFNIDNQKMVGLSTGFNLVGNPFIVDAYANRSYYKMNTAGTDIEVVENYAENPIPACTGIVVRATGPYESITFSTSAPQQQSANNNGNLQMTLTKAGVRNDAFQDKAIVSFNEGSELEKFIFNERHAKLYIPQYGEDYAIASSEMTGELPLNFKTRETGRYTIGFNFENVKGVRIQLIDKIEDRIIDLNANDHYTFMGSTTDRDDRFTLVFTQVEVDGVFAYQSGNDIIVSGEGELQVFDVMGRMVMNQRINGVETVVKPDQTGVYILRLNGMSQKIVVK